MTKTASHQPCCAACAGYSDSRSCQFVSALRKLNRWRRFVGHLHSPRQSQQRQPPSDRPQSRPLLADQSIATAQKTRKFIANSKWRDHQRRRAIVLNRDHRQQIHPRNRSSCDIGHNTAASSNRTGSMVGEGRNPASPISLEQVHFAHPQRSSTSRYRSPSQYNSAKSSTTATACAAGKTQRATSQNQMAAQNPSRPDLLSGACNGKDRQHTLQVVVERVAFQFKPDWKPVDRIIAALNLHPQNYRQELESGCRRACLRLPSSDRSRQSA